MNDLEDPITCALLAADTLRRAGVPGALYGGLLTAAYGEPRETRGADVAVLDVSLDRLRAAFTDAGVSTALAFENVTFGGLRVARQTLLPGGAYPGLNTVDLVTPLDHAYAERAMARTVEAPLRGSLVHVVSVEDFVILKVLSTRDRDLDDARKVLARNAAQMDPGLIRQELDALAVSLPEVPVAARRQAVGL